MVKLERYVRELTHGEFHAYVSGTDSDWKEFNTREASLDLISDYAWNHSETKGTVRMGDTVKVVWHYKKGDETFIKTETFTAEEIREGK